MDMALLRLSKLVVICYNSYMPVQLSQKTIDMIEDKIRIMRSHNKIK